MFNLKTLVKTAASTAVSLALRQRRLPMVTKNDCAFSPSCQTARRSKMLKDFGKDVAA